jgi:hypothetical protein
MPELERAAALNPRDSAVRIRLGLVAEQRGDFARAERDLLEAARIDRQFDPRATLAQYYFRRNAAGPFWQWVREALAVAYGDLKPLFELCWRMTDDSEVIRAALPKSHGVREQYLGFLLSGDHLDAAVPIASEFAIESAPADRDLLLMAVDQLLEDRNSAGALAVWNPLCGRLLPCSALKPEAGASLTNPAFRFEPAEHGFDWRVSHDPEITAARDAEPSLRISLSGRQAESCELIAQMVPLAAHRRYRFRARYRTSGMQGDTGLRWRILSAEAPLRASEEWTAADFIFSSESTSPGRLSFIYQRPSGSTRAEGSITLRDLDLSFAP